MVLTPDLYSRFTDFIHKKTGILFEGHKQYYVEKRLLERMESLGIESFREYLQLLKYSNDYEELLNLMNLLTVNETYFFRDFPQMLSFAEDVLPEVAKEKMSIGLKRIKVWSAGCSTGEEPYTLGIILLEMLPDSKDWEIEIAATDINTHVLDAARLGYYNNRSVKDVPPEYLEKYFTWRRDRYLINLSVKNLVTFKFLNFNDLNTRKDEFFNFDFIFCRNVLIYFSAEARLRVLEHFYQSLRSGGYIFLGHSESVSRITDAFRMKRINGNIVYYKP